MKSIKTLKNLKGKKIILRTDFNIPLGKNKKVDPEESWRVDKGLDTINFLKKQGAKTIVISHIGRDKKESLKPVSDFISKQVKLTFVDGHIQEFVHEAVGEMKDGDVVMLENLRQDPGEVGNSPSFARGLSRLADIYVNDAFSVCHRRHASIVGIPKYLKSYAGLQLEEEVKNLGKTLLSSASPFLFILGGAKFETKLPLVKKYLPKVDHLFVGGALQNNFFKSKGIEVGKSLIDSKKFNLGTLCKDEKLILPEDVVVQRKKEKVVISIDEIKTSDSIMDIGPKTIKNLSKKIKESKTVLWNGPLGFYEKGFTEGTESIVKALAKSDAKSIVGGGDTVVMVKKLKAQNKLTFVSTGGGAMLEYLQKGKLPGIEALK